MMKAIKATGLIATMCIIAPGLAWAQMNAGQTSSMGGNGMSMAPSSSMGTMSKSQMAAMKKCQAMSSDMMMKNKKCAAMAKMHPEMMQGGLMTPGN